jgi:hypothetical protein
MTRQSAWFASCAQFLCRMLLAFGTGYPAWACSGKPGPQVGGETHWLASCVEDRDCADDALSCVCGTCTRVCTADKTCGSTSESACFDVQSPLLLQRCDARTLRESGGVCLARCTVNTDCGAARSCSQGACVPSQPGDGGVLSPAMLDAGQAQPQLSTKDFAAVDASVPWTEAVMVPKPDLSIAGGDARLLGSWRQQGCDPGNMSFSWGCLRIEVLQSADGTLQGSLNFDRTFDVRGPFKPAQDPDHGYPVEVAVKDYSSLEWNPQVGVPYRMLNGSFANNRLTFAWSYFDIWHDWCGLQHPYPWQIGDQRFYFCVPQDTQARSMIDEAKDVLCTSADFDPLCPTDAGELLPCTCVLGSDNPLGVNNPKCSQSYCHCDSQSCDADLNSRRYQVDLTLQDGHLVGTWTPIGSSPVKITLQQESP